MPNDPIWEKIARISQQVPADEWDKLAESQRTPMLTQDEHRTLQNNLDAPNPDVTNVVNAMFDAANKVARRDGIKLAGDDRAAKVEAAITVWLLSS